MDAVGVRGRPHLKCNNRVLEYLRERRDGDVLRVDAVGIRESPPVKM